jgi:transcription elongation factor GreA
MDKQTYLTEDGKKKLEEELEHLRTTRRTEVAEKIRQAKEEGDISENSAYDEAKSEQAFLEGRIMTIESALRDAVLIQKGASSEIVSLGSHVTVRENGHGEPETYMIVGKTEADPLNGRISNESPIGKALMGKRKNDEVVAKTPSGELRFKIQKIE